MTRFHFRSSLYVTIVAVFVLTVFVSPASAYLYRLAWDDESAEGVVGYNVYRSQAGDEPVLLNDTPVAGTLFLDENITEQTLYTYFVTSVNAYGVESDPSDPIEVYTGTYGDMNGDDLAAADDLVLLAHFLSGNLDRTAPQIAAFRLVDMDDSFTLDAVDVSGLQNYIALQ
jgi:hypothetical protein